MSEKPSYERMPEGAMPPQYQPPGQPMMGQPQPMGYAPQPYGQPPPQPGYSTTNTTVVVQQPVAATAVVLQQGMRDWNSGLCACFDDIGSCLLGYFCPCCLLIDVSQRMGEGCCFACCCPGALTGLRVKLRAEQNIQGSLLDDYCVTQFCGVCSLCQLSRELRSLGR